MVFLPSISVLLILIIALFVIARNRRIINQLFVFFIISIAVWLLFDFLTDRSSNIKYAEIFAKLSFVGPILIAYSFYIFTIYFPRNNKKQNKKWLFVFSITPIILLFLTPTRALVKSISFEKVESALAAKVSFEQGWAYYIFVIYFIGYLFASFRNLIVRYHNGTGITKQQIRYLFTGIVISLIISFITNILLPLIGNNSLTKIGPSSSIIAICFITYAIIRHRLLDIRFVITRSLIYFFLILFVAGTFTGLTFLTSLLFQEALGVSRFITTGIVSLIIVIGLEPLKKWISRVTDNIFYKAKVDYQDVLQEVSEIINREIKLDSLITSVSQTIETRLKLAHATIAIPDGQGNFKEFGNHPDLPAAVIKRDSGVVRYLKSESKIAILESLERKIQDTSDQTALAELERSRSELESLHAGLAAPIITQGKLNALLILGPKLSGDSYSGEEVRLFNTLTPQIGSAIEKSRLYEEVKGFSSQLEEKVRIATRELTERNRSLIALQHVTGLITRSLDFQKVLQGIANSISTELGYIGGVVMLIEPGTRKAYLGALTETALTKQALKLLPKSAYELTGTIDDPDLASKSMRTGQMQVSDKLEEFLSPPLPKLVSQGIQKIVKAKTIVSVPIYSENEIIGALVYILARPKNEVSAREYEVMRSVADQTGITTRNLRFIDQIKKVNAELEQANIHLRQLDQAKSEFVSIASHQLRTPMTGIMGYLSMLVDGDFGRMKPEHSKLLSELLSESQRMIRLINLFLNVSKIESGKLSLSKQPTQVSDLIRQQIRDQVKNAEAKGLILKFEAPQQLLPVVQLDSDKIMNVIQNLIDNAIKYTERGTVTVRAYKTDSHIEVDIQDTGVGIKKKDVGELFKKFVRGSGIAQINPDGSGLGLFIAKSIVEMHGGKIWVTSEGEGKGSTFSFTIPVK